MNSLNSERKHGFGRGLSKNWLFEFKPKPLLITAEEVLASKDRCPTDNNIQELTSKFSKQQLEKPKCGSNDHFRASNAVPLEEKPKLNTVLLNAVNAAPFIPSLPQNTSFHPIVLGQDHVSGIDEKPQNFALGDTDDKIAHNILMNAFLTLTENRAAEFDQLLTELSINLEEHVKTEESLKNIIRVILKQAIAEVNFTYGASRMFNFFNENNVFGTIGDKPFRTTFLKECQQEYNSMKEKLANPPHTNIELKTFSNTAILFGELYCNMKINGKVIFIYKNVIVNIVNIFLESKQEILVRCLTRLLKLVGPQMDVDRPKDVEEMFNKVRDFCLDNSKCERLPPEVRNSLLNVYKLHSRDWDKLASSTSPLQGPVAEGSFVFGGDELPHNASMDASFVLGDDELAHNILMDAILKLTENPGDIDQLIAGLSMYLTEYVKTEESLKKMIRIILEKAITETNFSYGASRMCQFFGENDVFGRIGDEIFRTTFSKECQKEYNSMKEKLANPTHSATELKTFSNTAILFGELYCNMKIDDRVINTYKNMILNIVDIFLESKQEVLVRCLTRLLKLVGPQMDVDRPKDVEEMFNKVSDFCLDNSKCERLPPEIKNSLLNVYELHSRDWDRLTSSTSTSQGPVPDSPNVGSSGIDWNDFYAGDDNDIYNYYFSPYEDPSQSYGVYFEEDELGDAYEEFLRESGQI